MVDSESRKMPLDVLADHLKDRTNVVLAHVSAV